MDALGDRLVRLLAGDCVRLETPARTVTAEVLANDQTTLAAGPSGTRSRHTVRFMPVGEDAKTVGADRLHVSVEPSADGSWAVGPLVAEVFDEDELAYASEPWGALTGLEPLDLSG